jgi:spectinomycin phosphotransferase
VNVAVNTSPPGEIDPQELSDALAHAWALEVGHLRYIPKGFGSYHWVAETPGHRYFLTVDDLDTKPWLGRDRESTFEGLEAAYFTALALRRYDQLGFVVAPIPRLDDSTVLRLSERYTLTVFPFTEGEPGVWGDPISGHHREQLLRHLAELHGASPEAGSRAPRHHFVIHDRVALDAALDDLGLSWTGGPFSEPARHELTSHAAAVREWLTSFDRLAHQVESAQAEPVITHGEPHPGNLILTDDGVYLVDWDTVGLAPPERDLWMLDDGSSDAFATYRAASGRAVDETAVALFRLAWTLTEIAAFIALFRSDHERDQGTERSWRVLAGSLKGADSTLPYGVLRI